MDRSVELLRLQQKLAAATAEFTTATNEKFLAVIRDDPDTSRFDAKLAKAKEKRKLAMDNLLNHVREHGW